jgi:hypothetical protein
MVLASVSLILLGACAHPGVGVDVGIVYRGGPAPGNSDVLRPGTVEILTADGELKASGRVQDGQEFHTTLPPGNYMVVTHSGDAGCASRAITVVDGSPASLHVACSIK